MEVIVTAPRTAETPRTVSLLSRSVLATTLSPSVSLPHSVLATTLSSSVGLLCKGVGAGRGHDWPKVTQISDLSWTPRWLLRAVAGWAAGTGVRGEAGAGVTTAGAPVS